jgi:hypothetical protein
LDKAEERYYLDLCLKLRPNLVASDIRDSEAPDFLAVNGGECIGIELVRFDFPHQAGPSPVAIDSYRSQLAKFLREEHTIRQIPPVHASVHFSQERPLASAGRQHLGMPACNVEQA